MKLVTLITLLLIGPKLFGQLISAGTPRQLTREELITDSVNKHCIHQNKFSPAERLKNFPFNKAAYVSIASFGLKENSLGNEIPRRRGKVDIAQLKDIIALNADQVDTLTDILYNTGYKGNFYSFSEGCYIPRNAILFMDAKGNAFEYIEICFGCEGFKASSKKVKTGDFCAEKYELLKIFFRNAGIKFGESVESE